MRFGCVALAAVLGCVGCAPLQPWGRDPNEVVVETDAYASEQTIARLGNERCAELGFPYARLKSQTTTVSADTTYGRRFLFECLQ
jgi:hypothetical protein